MAVALVKYPPKFDDQIAWLIDVVNGKNAKPTQGCYDLYNDLQKQNEAYLQQVAGIIQSDLKKFNEEVARQGVGGVIIEAVR